MDGVGAGNEIRTRDLNLGKVALYQLSYSRLNLKPVRILSKFVLLARESWRPLGDSNPCYRRERAVS